MSRAPRNGDETPQRPSAVAGAAPASLSSEAFDREALALAEQSAGVGVWSIDLVTGHVRATAQFFRIMGLPPTSESIPVDLIRSLRHPEDAERVVAGFRRALEGGGDSYEIEYRIIRPDGQLRWIFGRGRVIRDDGGTPLRYSGVDLDITDRKATEAALSAAKLELERMNKELEQRVLERTAELEAEAARRAEAEDRLRQMQKMEAVGQLTGGIAHDFNNILQVIMGNLEIVKLATLRGEARDEQHQRHADIERAITIAQRAAFTAKDVVQRLLAFGRRQPLAPAPVELNVLVRGMTDIIDRALGATIVVETDLAEGTWPVFADRNQMESALLNLVVNARDAMPDGGRLRIETRNVDFRTDTPDEFVPGRYVRLAVTDNGCGIPADCRQRVFEPFFTTKDPGKGSGLGLSMVYGFVRQSGGHVRLDSEVGMGTTVSIYLPCAEAHGHDTHDPLADRTPAAEAPKRARAGEVILLVEDDEDVRHLACSALENLGYDVVAAADADSALQLLNTPACARLDLLFTDMVLPGGTNGRDLARAVRRMRPRLPVLFASGFTRDALAGETGEFRDGDVLRKPYLLETLAVRCRQAIDTAAIGESAKD